MPGGAPRVSLGMPVYNGEAYLTDALRSILDQDFEGFELVVSDNGSTDATEALCRDAAGRDPRVRYHREPENRGASWNFNRVVELSVGEYFKWASHDDLLAPAYLRTCVSVIDDGPPSLAIAYPLTMLIDENGTPVRVCEDPFDIRLPRPHERLRAMLRTSGLRNVVFGLMRSRVLRSTRLLLPFNSSDVLLLSELSLRGEFWNVPEPLFLRRVHEGMSRRANLTPRDVARWFDPTRRGDYFPWTRLFVEHVRSIRQAPLTADERNRALAVLVQEWPWKRVARDYTDTLLEVASPRRRPRYADFVKDPKSGG